MSLVTRGELLGLAEYEQVREAFRRRIMALKQARRVALGTNMTVLFENHDTALFQIQEMSSSRVSVNSRRRSSSSIPSEIRGSACWSL
jgi:hypothetical protein